ncbi:MAG TPA: hypothetical protein VH109_12245 [Steroidobacteraceae bacterium]|jgi:hypothetical protein|nr:hypothetical protein [Steroidobacteraceae bacterium]
MTRRLSALFTLVALGLATLAHAEPYLAVAYGFKCSQCHVNPTGGGERNVYGETFAQTLLPAQHIDTGTDTWTGQLNRFISMGGDLRFDGTVTSIPGTQTTNQFDLEQARVYLSANVIPDRLSVYIDELVAPGGALNREAWAMFWWGDHTWYVKGGQMYLPFGLRLQDQSAFVKEATGINMLTPDDGVELGWIKGHWDAQLAVSNGTAGAAPTSNGKQESLQVSYVEARWRLGLAANFNDASSTGTRNAYGIFGGLKTGPIAWLAELDLIEDHSVPSPIPGKNGVPELAGLIEGNWMFRRGNNIKVTYEYFDPNRDVANDQQTRWSVLYEWTPIQFVQLRLGARLNDGIPQLPAQHEKLYFIELHGFF